MKKCWICGSPATSGEHKIKRTDLVRVHGNGQAFTQAELSYLKSNGSVVNLQGPNSKHLKYIGVLCELCNNEKSQPFDTTYDEFISYLESNQTEVLSKRQINLQKIYGKNWEEKQLNLFRYFVKTIGCRIADADQTVPIDLIEILQKKSFSTPLYICIAINEDELLKPDAEQKLLRIGNLITNEPARNRFAFAYYYRWLVVSFWYGWGPFGPVGERWCADLQYVCLGSYSQDQAVPIIPEAHGLVQWPGFGET